MSQQPTLHQSLVSLQQFFSKHLFTPSRVWFTQRSIALQILIGLAITLSLLAIVIGFHLSFYAALILIPFPMMGLIFVRQQAQMIQQHEKELTQCTEVQPKKEISIQTEGEDLDLLRNELTKMQGVLYAIQKNIQNLQDQNQQLHMIQSDVYLHFNQIKMSLKSNQTAFKSLQKEINQSQVLLAQRSIDAIKIEEHLSKQDILLLQLESQLKVLPQSTQRHDQQTQTVEAIQGNTQNKIFQSISDETVIQGSLPGIEVEIEPEETVPRKLLREIREQKGCQRKKTQVVRETPHIELVQETIIVTPPVIESTRDQSIPLEPKSTNPTLLSLSTESIDPMDKPRDVEAPHALLQVNQVQEREKPQIIVARGQPESIRLLPTREGPVDNRFTATKPTESCGFFARHALEDDNSDETSAALQDRVLDSLKRYTDLLATMRS